MAREPVRPNPENATLEELETAARCAKTRAESDRYRVIKALILFPDQRAEVFALYAYAPRSILRWIHAFNKRGIDGLITEPKPGRPRKITSERSPACRRLLDHPDEAGRCHWTGRKLHGYLRDTLQIEVGYSTVLRFMHQEGYRLKVPQPWPDRQDEQQRKAFCERLKALDADPGVDLWFGDEMGVEGDPRPRRRWAKRGEKTRSTKNGDHIRMNVTGIVCPRTGECYTLEFSHSDRETFQVFLDEANKDLALERKRQVLIVDNASWHKVKTLNWGRFEPVYLPPYSPDLNPIERLWLLVKAEWFTNWHANSREELMARLDQALRWIMNRHNDNVRTCAIRTEL